MPENYEPIDLQVADHRLLMFGPDQHDQVIRELVQNAIEAIVPGFTGSRVRITSLKDGRGTRVEDYSRGMNAGELGEYFGGIFIGSKEIGRDKNFGLGAKASVSRAGTMTVKSWTQNGKFAHEIVLRATANKIQIVPDPHTGKRVRQIDKAPLAKKAPHGTIIDCAQYAYDPQRVLLYLNQRFLEFPCPVEVEFPPADGKGPSSFRRARGLLECMKSACMGMDTGTVELKHSTLHWGILPKPPSQPEVPKQTQSPEEWVTMHVSEAVGNEAIHSWSLGKGGTGKLKAAGVSQARDRVIFVIVAKGRKIESDFMRNTVQGWPESEALDEIGDNLPEQIHQLIDSYYITHTETIRQGVLDYLLDKMGDQIALLPSSDGRKKKKKVKPEDPPTTTETEEDEDDEQDPEKKTRSRRRSTGMLEVQFVTSGLGTLSCDMLRMGKKRICQVNLGYPTIQKLLEGLSIENRQRRLTAINLQLVLQYHAWKACNPDKEPDDANMRFLLEGAPLFALCDEQRFLNWPSETTLKRHAAKKKKEEDGK